jgi:hypothetical protein
MIEARPWLPDSCLTSERSIGAVADIVARWSAHWFVTPPLTLSDRWTRHEGQTVGATDWAEPIAIAPGLAIQPRVGADAAVGPALLSIPTQRATPYGADQHLLRTAGGAILSDLEKRLSHLHCQSGNAAKTLETSKGEELFELSLSDSAGRPVIRIVAASALLVDIVKREVKPRRSLPIAALRSEAVTTKQVEYAARVGSARLSYADLLGLAVSDVLILDTDRKSQFDLLVDGQIAAPRAVAPKEKTTPCISPKHKGIIYNDED